MDSQNCYSSGDEYEENEEEMLSIQCLFCGQRSPKFDEMFVHMNVQHSVDFVRECRSRNLDLYGFFKVVNYVRKNSVIPEEFGKALDGREWDSEAFLTPNLPDDDFLMFDFDEIDDENDQFSTGNSGDEPSILSPQVKNILDAKNLKDLKEYYADKSVDKILEDMFKLKLQYEQTKNCLEVLKNNMEDSVRYCDDSSSDSGDDNDQKDTERRRKRTQKSGPTAVKNLSKTTDSNYIDSYSHYGIHHEMLSDVPRTMAYRDSMLKNPESFRGKTVLDIGCGTGILSMFAARAGARLVVGVDMSEIVHKAKQIVSANGLDSVVKIVGGKLEDIDWKAEGLPEKFDIIISEWMGYFLLYEGMLDTVLYARDHFMVASGSLLPNESRMYLAAFDDRETYKANIDFWDDVYGFDMTIMKPEVVRDASIDTVDAGRICSDSALIGHINIDTCQLQDVQTINSDFTLRFEKDSTVHGFVGWFDCHFSSFPEVVILSTAPAAKTTHWKQTLFYLKSPLVMAAGSELKGHLSIVRSNRNIRALNVRLNFPERGLSLEYCVE